MDPSLNLIDFGLKPIGTFAFCEGIDRSLSNSKDLDTFAHSSQNARTPTSGYDSDMSSVASGVYPDISSPDSDTPPPLPPKRRTTGGHQLLERLKNAGYNVQTPQEIEPVSSTDTVVADAAACMEGVTFQIVESVKSPFKPPRQSSLETEESTQTSQPLWNTLNSLNEDKMQFTSLDHSNSPFSFSVKSTIDSEQGRRNTMFASLTNAVNSKMKANGQDSQSSNRAHVASGDFTTTKVTFLEKDHSTKHAHFVKRDSSLTRASFRGPHITPPMLFGRVTEAESSASVKENFRERFAKALGRKDNDLIEANMREFEGLSHSVSMNILSPRHATGGGEMISSTERLSMSLGDLLQMDESKKPLKNLSAEDLEQLMRQDGRSEINHGKITGSSSVGDMIEGRGAPPRPPLPKPLHRFSAPQGMNVDTDDQKRSQIKSEQFDDLFFGDGMFDVVEERNEEAVSFCRSVADLRKLYRFHDLTNVGYVSCPRFSCNPDFLSGNQKLWKAVIYLDPHHQPREFMCNLLVTRNEFIARALSLFQGRFNALDYLSDEFVLKVKGRALYLTGNYPLIEYEVVQNCLKLEQDLELSLVPTEKINNELARTKEDDAEEFLGTYFQHFFEIPSQTSVSRQGLSILLDAYNSEVSRLIADITSEDNPRYVPEKLIQTVKALSMALSYIETNKLQEAIQLLLVIKPRQGERKAYTISQPNIKDFNRLIDPTQFDKGRFHLALEKLTSAVTSLVSLYCKAFDTDFNVNQHKGTGSESIERLDVRSVHDKFSCRVSSVHRIPLDWKTLYDYFEVECGLYYGAKLLCPRLLTKLSKPTIGFFEHIRWDELVIFEKKTCDLPRETRIGFSLYGLTSPSKKTGNELKSRNLLGWIVKNVFDFRGLLISDSFLFGLLNDGEPNPAATCASNYIQNQSTSILKVDFEVYHTEIIFPELFVPPITARSASNLYLPEPEALLKLECILDTPHAKLLTEEELGILWNCRLYCRNIPKALPFVIASCPGWDAESVAELHDLISSWEHLTSTMALELLKADYPDCTIRKFAIQWLATITVDEVCDYLPQLVQGLKYESYHDSELARFLIQKGLSSPRIAHHLFWHLKYYIGDPQFCQRFQIVLGGFLSICGSAMREQLSRQDRLISILDQVAKKVRESKDNLRMVVLKESLSALADELSYCYRLPTDPSCKVKDILPEESSYFSSYTVPLSLAFDNADPRGDKVSVMFKMGDDLRKDLLTLQLFRVMNKLWLKEGLDLRLITYSCMPTGPLTGMIELIPSCATLREIHSLHGVTGSFKDDSISLWLQKYNSTDDEYQKAVRNFTASCAGCCVATYILGIGDRHNDNVMLSQKGHMFHIDFSKFMGNAQKFGSIKRDRVPFVLTPDMAFVINGSETMSSNFQQFIEFCCQAFNILRHNSVLILNLLGLMVSSGIPYLSEEEDIEYVRNALQLPLTDGEATSYFTRLIENSLTSKSTQLNFFIHNMAHIKDIGPAVQGSGHRAVYSFTNKVYSAETDGELQSARVVDFQKRYLPEKHYIFVINVIRKGRGQPSFVFRKFEEFQELHEKICNLFSNTQLPSLPGKVLVGRSQVREVAVRRRRELDGYLEKLTKIPMVFRSELVYTFLHSYIRDEQDMAKFAEILEMLEEGGPQSRVSGELKVSYQYRDNTLHLLVMHARNLIPRSVQGYAEPYVKAYLLPDPTKATKRKTKIIRKNLNPTFNETLTFQMSLSQLQRRTLQITVWDHDTLRENHYLGGINIYLSTMDLSKEHTKWFKLKDLGI